MTFAVLPSDPPLVRIDPDTAAYLLENFSTLTAEERDAEVARLVATQDLVRLHALVTRD